MPTSIAHHAEYFLQQLDASVAEVFALMLGHRCAPAPHCPIAAPGFIALIAFSGSLTGTCALHLGLASAGELTSKLTGQPPAPDSSLPADTVGELCNMIAGSWKSRLPPPLASCHLSSPTVSSALRPYNPPTQGATGQSLAVTSYGLESGTLATRAYRFATHCLTLELSLAPQ